MAWASQSTDRRGKARKVLLTAGTYSKLINPADKSVRTLFGDGATATLITADGDENSIGPSVYGTDGADAGNLIVPACACAKQLLAKAGATQNDIDLFVFHQANRFILDHLRRKLQIPAEKFVVPLEQTGNTVSSSIPMALPEAQEK